jgi:hypothetical protein
MAAIFIRNGVVRTGQYTERFSRVQRTLQSTMSLHIFPTNEKIQDRKDSMELQVHRQLLMTKKAGGKKEYQFSRTHAYRHYL